MRVIGEHLVVDEARVGRHAGVVGKIAAVGEAAEAVSVVLQRRARGRVVGAGRRDGREARVVTQIRARQVRVARPRLIDLRELPVRAAGGQGRRRIERRRAAREVGIDLRPAVALPIGVQDRDFGGEGLGRLPQEARAPGEGLLIVPVGLVLVDRGARHRLGRVGEQRDPRQAVVGALEEPVGVDESRLIVVLRRRAEREHVAERYVDEAPQRVRRPVRVLELAAARLDLRRPRVELRGVGNEPQCPGERAGAVERALRPAQHFDLLQVIQLEVAVDRRVADVGPHRRLLEGAEAARRLAGRIDAADDGYRGQMKRAPYWYMLKPGTSVASEARSVTPLSASRSALTTDML